VGQHNHLDRARREPGDCPACDDDWLRQRALIASGNRVARAERQLQRLHPADPDRDRPGAPLRAPQDARSGLPAPEPPDDPSDA